MKRPAPRSGILDVPTYMRGLSKVEGHDRAIKLSSNENPFGPSPLAVAAALGELDKMHLYPEAGQG
ncbi:MAG: histidinol-phosphate transaminase, partial [Proteobacteria bacterium]|nr:histidinol-phosphate transaminase [Pseudomonadota bacterium]